MSPIERWMLALSRYYDYVRQVEGVRPGEEERADIAAHLCAVGVKETDIEWMANSCPSLITAQRLYPARTE